MNIESKTAQLVSKLMRETSEGLVSWKVEDAPDALWRGTETIIPLYLQTNYKGTVIGIYEVRSKHFYDEHDFHWSEGLGLCVVDRFDKVIWESNEYSPALQSLYETAREDASGINDILDNLLNDSPC